MKRPAWVLAMSIMLLMPFYATAQSSDRISLLDTFGEFDKGESVFVFGSLPRVLPDSFLILKIINPQGDLCQIQQLTPLSNGLFLTEPIPLKGRVCGISGDYEIKVFYGSDSTTSKFTLTTKKYQEKTGGDYFDSAVDLISEKIITIAEQTGAGTLLYSERLELLRSQPSEDTLAQLEELYADLWDDFFIEEELFEIDTSLRPATKAALDTTAELIEDGKLPFEVARDIDRQTFGAIFYSQIGDTQTAVEKLNDVFVSITNVDPVKVTSKQTPSFAELEETLLNIMTKTHSIMSRDVKEEVAFIFARGTGPIYTQEINQMIDLLSKSRYLDVILRNSDPLYRLVHTDWESTKSSLINQESIEDLLLKKEKVDKLHQAALLLRELDDVDQFLSSDAEENSDLANLILPEWNDLQLNLELAHSADDIFNSETDIRNMKNVVEASSRISKTVEISKQSNVNSELIQSWESLLTQVENAGSVSQILEIVLEFDTSITELREKRNPLTILKFEYEALKARAELQADYENLFYINNALRIIDTAQKMEEGSPSLTKIDRIEVLLTWASEKAPEIKTDLYSYSKDAYKIRASDILQRAKSIENLVDLSLRKNKFLPNYIEFTDSMKEKVDEARDLVIKNDLDAADDMVRQLMADWQEVTLAYADDPYGSDVGYSIEELQRIEYRKKLDSLSSAVTNFYTADFEPYSEEYVKMSDQASEFIDYGNFVDAELKFNEIRKYLSDYLVLNNKRIIYDISYDQEDDIWIMSGAVDKPVFDRRERLYITVYDMDGEVHSNLKFTDTRDGEFYTQWKAPTKPGLYIVMLQYQDAKASQIVNVEEKAVTHRTETLDSLELAREFEELITFIEAFGRENLEKNNYYFEPVLNDIKEGLADRDSKKVSDKLSELNLLIERYLPVRSKSAVIEAHMDNDKLSISGSIVKPYLAFREDLFVDIYNQKGERIDEIFLKDTPSAMAGKFNEILSKPYEPGMYVAQLWYHDLMVSDFFYVR